MMTEREIFFEVLEIATPEERGAYLQGACAGDITLRRRVDDLLKEHFSNDSLLTGPAVKGDGPNRPIPISEPEEAPAQIFGRYKLLEKIGEGGFGEVWMAQQREPVKRRVALKIIKLGMDSRQIVARFEAERQALAMMDHPNIARIFDADVTETGRLYFVMELVRGIKITEYCDQNQLPTLERLKLFIQVCKAIQHAHQKGIIHRDIKPSNILVTLHDGVPVPKVIDFGIAKATQQELTDKTVFTQFHQFIGTPAYISPEQAEMSGLDIDTRADIYSLGVLLYELLVGQTPFDAKEMMQCGLEVLRQIIREKEPLRPSTRLNTLHGEARTTAGKRRQTDVGKLVHQLQGDLDWIVMKCLEKDRARRYETANGLANDIERHLNNEAVLARPASAVYRAQKLVRRNKRLFAAIGAVIAALLVGLLASVREAVRTKRAENEARRQLYVSDMIVANKAWSEGNIRRVEELLDGQVPKRGSREDLRGFEYYYLRQQCAGEQDFTFPPQESKVFALAYSPDGKVLATGSSYLEQKDYSGELKLFDVNSRKEIHNFVLLGPDGTPTRDGIRSVAFSPDGKLLASGSAGSVVTLWDPVTRQKLDSFYGRAGPAIRMAFSPDGRLLASIFTGGIIFWDTVARKETNVFNLPRQSSSALAFSPDGRLLVFADAQSNSRSALRLWDLESQSVVAETALSFDGDINSLDFSLDSKAVSCGLSSGFVALWEIQAGRIIKLGRHHDEVISAVFSRDGRHLATSSADSTVKLWDAVERKEIRLLKGHSDRVDQVVFSPDGSHLASVSRDKTVRFWPVAPAEKDVLRGHVKGVIAVDFSPDGQLLATASAEKSVKIWDPNTRELRQTLTDITNEVLSVTFSADGKYLAAGHLEGVNLWDVKSWLGVTHLTNPRRDPPSQGSQLRFSLDSKFLVAGEKGFTDVWEVGSWRALTNLSGSSGRDVAFSNNGKLLATGIHSETVQLWEVGTWRLLQTLTSGRGFGSLEFGHAISTLAFTPDSHALVTGSVDSTIRIWDLTTGEQTTLRGQAGKVMALAISPLNGKTLAASDMSGVKLWNLATGKELFTLVGHEASVLSLAFSPDGMTLASGSSDTTVRLWRATISQNSNATSESSP